MNSSNEYQQSYDWAYELYLSRCLWLRRAIFGLITLMILLLLSLSANLLLLPLKEKVLYLYAFDQASGEITKLGVLEPVQIKNNWALSRYLLAHYVRNYEGYHYDNIDLPYQLVWAQSSKSIQQQYDALVNSKNKQSPYRQYGKDKYITVKIFSINQLNDNTVDIKFEKTLHDRAMGTQNNIQKEAIVRWRYEKANTTQKMLDRDPLGFKVTYYQSTQVNQGA